MKQWAAANGNQRFVHNSIVVLPVPDLSVIISFKTKGPVKVQCVLGKTDGFKAQAYLVLDGIMIEQVVVNDVKIHIPGQEVTEGVGFETIVNLEKDGYHVFSVASSQGFYESNRALKVEVL